MTDQSSAIVETGAPLPGAADPGPRDADRRGLLTALLHDMSVSAWLAGLIAVVVAFAGPSVIILQAASAGHLTAAQTTSWLWAIGVGSGVLCLGLSLWTRTPAIAAWSTPGSALLVTSIDHFSYATVIGAYLVSALAVVFVGISGWFGRLMRAIPAPLVSAMLAGILLPFCIDAVSGSGGHLVVPGAAVLGYLVGKRISDRWSVPLALACGVLAAVLAGRLHTAGLAVGLAQPHWTTPAFSLSAVIGIGLPLFIVTMTAQNAAGVAVSRSFGYDCDDRRLITATGVASLVFAPFGSHGLNLSSITAAICSGPTAHPDPRRRYVAGVACGVFYILVGTFASVLTAVFTDLPPGLIATVAGLALLGALIGSLGASLADTTRCEPALITFLATASGLTLLGVGSAFWGLVLGGAAEIVLNRRRAPRETRE
ncbi:benzoate/H(+) symporter BenE family transporter [Leekyejoonella antrihumi]|uniref:Benzoate/H(+) symporter BenE family transporter n=1 Tax=Leekyejoonella antrihumi TaxID=1660198 RepID=A0A563E0M9_9MICO|nr:benzoate/H(+) symporter BenE family transporter [Leekyejoonella antrihumi]TWP35929.1 benzoate/H(+) symporter BenE family transporter [Leekyejoonella antrihumi]